jgi:NADH-quinone oxidoreductase subunit E
MLTKQEIAEIDEELKLVPLKSAACIEALKIIQSHRGWVSDESISDLAAYLDMSSEELDNVATFYNLIFRKPVGRHVILLCDSVSCYLLGYQKIRNHLEDILGIKYGETTPDNRFTLLPIPCLGTCDHAPAMIIDDDLHKDLTAASIESILEKYK